METYVVRGNEIKEEELSELSKRDIFNLEPLGSRLLKDFKVFRKGYLKPNETLVALNKVVGYRCKAGNYASAELLLHKLKRHVTLNRFRDNLGKEINKQPSYEEYCKYIFDLLVFKRKKDTDLIIQRMVNEFVVLDLKANLVRPVKNKELLKLAFKTLNGKDISDLEYKVLSALVWRLDKTVKDLQGEFGSVDIDNLKKTKDIYYSYLELLNLKQYRDAWDMLCVRMSSDLNFALKFYYPILFSRHAVTGEFKRKLEDVRIKLEENRKEEISTLHSELIKDLTSGEVIKHGEGKNLLLISRYGIGELQVDDYTITFMEPSFYSTLEMNNVYDFSKFNYIKDYRDLNIKIFRG